MSEEQEQQPATRVVVAPRKSLILSLVLTFFFGPLGMLYATIGGALVMIAVSIIAALLTAGGSIVITWVISMIWGALSVERYNRKMFEKAIGS
jgi:hypothetical protein